MLLARAGLCVVSAGIFLATRQPWLVVAAAMVGNLAVGAGEAGPFLALEQVAGTGARPRAPRRGSARGLPVSAPRAENRRAVRARLPRGRLRDPEPRGLLVLHALPARPRQPRLDLLRRPAPLGAPPAGRREAP